MEALEGGEGPARHPPSPIIGPTMAPIWVFQRGCYGIVDRPLGNKLLSHPSPRLTELRRRRLDQTASLLMSGAYSGPSGMPKS